MKQHIYTHSPSGDAKVPAETPGSNILPDGTLALTASLVERLAAASQAAKDKGGSK